MSGLTIAIPSKGRLKDNAETFFARCGFKLRQKGGERGYSAELKGLPDADIMLLSAREIAQGLIDGSLHVGVTGEDLLHDLSANVDDDVAVIKPLGFGHADVVVAVPQAWLDVSTMAGLEAAGALFRERHGRRLRVATKYMRLTRRHFAAHSVGEYRLVESAGATEAAPSSGAAEVIVDITSTGATLKANGLKVLDDGVMLRSQAALTGSLRADWGDAARASLVHLLDSVAAQDSAEANVMLTLGKPAGKQILELAEGAQLLGPQTLLCPKPDAARIASQLSSAGLGPVGVQSSTMIFSSDNVICRNFLQKLAKLT